MKVKIKRIDKSLPLPKYQTKGAVAFDLYVRETVVVEPQSVVRIPGNLVVVVPEGYMLLIKDRSSTAKKKGLLITAGVIDQDYCGPDDELLVQYFNFGSVPVTVERGERIAQAVLVKIGLAEWEEVDEMDGQSRGGFGTTG